MLIYRDITEDNLFYLLFTNIHKIEWWTACQSRSSSIRIETYNSHNGEDILMKGYQN